MTGTNPLPILLLWAAWAFWRRDLVHIGHALRYWCIRARGSQPDDKVVQYLEAVYGFRFPDRLPTGFSRVLRFPLLVAGLGGLLAITVWQFSELWFLLHTKATSPPDWMSKLLHFGLVAVVITLLICIVTFLLTPSKTRKISAAVAIFGSVEAAHAAQPTTRDPVSRWAFPMQSGPLPSSDTLRFVGAGGVALALAIMPSVALFSDFLGVMCILAGFVVTTFTFVGLMMTLSTWHPTENDTLPYVFCVFSRSLPSVTRP